MKIAYIGIDLLVSALYSLYKNKCDIVEIYTCNTDNKTEFNIKVTDFAKKHNIPIKFSPISESDLLNLKHNGVDFIISAGYYHKIPTSIDIPIINIHPSLLPEGRGAWPMPIYLLDNKKCAGVTFHKVVDNLDCGDIILQKEFLLSSKDNHQTFIKKVDKCIEQLIPVLLNNFFDLYNNAAAQSNGSYWEMPQKSDFTVSENMSFEEIDKVFRAFYGYEVFYTDGENEYELIFASIKKRRTFLKKVFKTIPQGYVYAKSIKKL